MGMPPTIEVASLGMTDSLILMVLALVVFGPRRLPQIGRQMGKLMYEFRKASNDFKFQMEEELRNAEEADRRQKEEERLRTLAAPAQPAQTIEAVDASAAVPVESPYPGEEVYPPVIAAAAEAPAQETVPRIQPPSTGETVPVERPWSLEEELAKVSAPSAAPAASKQPAAESKGETPSTEQAVHHG
jgi:sec-independent protein translocase protein TatB